MSSGALATTLLCITFTIGLVLVLMFSDAKRHRRSAQKLQLSPALRKSLAWMAVLPVFILPVFGFYTGLLIWIGSVTVIGWALAVLPSDRI